MRLAACLGLAPADVQDNGSPDPEAPIQVRPRPQCRDARRAGRAFPGAPAPCGPQALPHSSIRPPTLSAHQGREAGAEAALGESSGIPGGAERSARPWSRSWCPHPVSPPPWHHPRPVLKGHRGWRAQTCTSLQGRLARRPQHQRPRPRPSGNPGPSCRVRVSQPGPSCEGPSWCRSLAPQGRGGGGQKSPVRRQGRCWLWLTSVSHSTLGS